MTRPPRTAVLAALGLSCLVLLVGGSGQAEAAPILTLPSGLLSVTVPTAAALTTSGSTISGSLGTTLVVDGRVASAGYSVSVSTAGFDLVGPSISSSPVTHIPASAATVQVTGTTGGTPSTTSAVALPSALPIFLFTYSSPVSLVNLLSSYTLAMVITVPSQAGPGAYVGTVTQTVA